MFNIPVTLQYFTTVSVMEPLVESYPQFAEYGDLKDITPLHWACYHGNYKVAELLLEKVNYMKIEFVFFQHMAN